jgi:hypothetical protein
MNKFVKLFALLLILCANSRSQTTGNVTYLQFAGVPSGSCTATQLAVNTSTGNLYTCTGAAWTNSAANLSVALINNTVWVDGVKYPYTAAGLQQAILDANGHGGLAGVVMIGSTANGVSTLQQIALGTTSITVPSFTYIIGAGRDATGVDYIGGGAAFDFPAGTQESGIFNLGIEIDELAPGTCFTFEGNVNLQNRDNIIQNVSCGSSAPAPGQTGLTLTTTPAGANGANYIHDDIFQNVWFFQIEKPISSNGDFSNKFTGITVDSPVDNAPAVNGGFYNDRLEVTVHKQWSKNITALALGGYGNVVELYCDLSSVAGNACLNDTGGGNHVVVSNLNLTPLGNRSGTSYTESLSPEPVMNTIYQPSTNTSSNCSAFTSPAACGSASAGSVAMTPGLTTLVVNTSAVTADSQILLTVDSSLSSKLGLTCASNAFEIPSVTARTPGQGFTITLSSAPNRTSCLNFLIIN